MKKYAALLLSLLCLLAFSGCRDDSDRGGGSTTSAKPVIYLYPDADGEVCDAKPNVYLYPEKLLDVTVRLDYDGELTCAYPAYGDGWHVAAAPDGTLTDASGQTYSYLYWEGVTDVEYDFSQGFCVAGADTAAFLEDALARLGLTRREANEFIVYWLPQMEGSAYNLIAFQADAYTDHARLTVEPAPDALLRVFMAWRPLEAPVPIEAQEFPAFERRGFTVVEWGGAKVAGSGLRLRTE